MNQMEEALYRCGAHIVFKQVRPDQREAKEPTNKMKVPVPIWRVKANAKIARQRMIGGIPRDPANKQAAVVTSPANWIHKPL